MTIFKTYLKILNRNKFVVILYTIILVIYAGLNMQTSESSIGFVATKPDVLIINNDENEGITKNLIEYFDKNSNLVNIENDEEKINDALFYREVNYIIYIPENYHTDYMNNNNPKIEIKSTGDYLASYSEMLLKRYLDTTSIYLTQINDEELLVEKVNETLNDDVNVTMKTKLDEKAINKAVFYFNFESYSILSCLIFVICMVLSTFNNEKIRKKNIISSTKFKKINNKLLISNFSYAFVMWLFYFLLSFIFVGKVMLSLHGLLFAINSLLFTFTATTIAFLVCSFNVKQEAISGIVNVIALGSSFLCGAFVPLEYLPDLVIKIGKLLPTYWYIYNNETISKLEDVNIANLNIFMNNIIVLVLFGVIYIVISNIINRRRIKLN